MAPAPAALQPVPAPPAPVPLDVRGYAPPAAPSAPPQATWLPPTNGHVRLDVPQPEQPRPSVRLQGPEVTEVPRSDLPRLETIRPEPARTEPPLATPARPDDRAASPPLPVGIPQFAAARDRVTSGLKPSLDGLDWLQANGYRAVLHVRAPDEADTADRKVVESRGLKYLGLEMSPQNLGPALDDFNRLVANTSNLPLFVYDRDGMLAGSLWYLHFRTVDRASDSEARRKAVGLGLKEEVTPANRTLWLAIQEYLRKYLP